MSDQNSLLPLFISTYSNDYATGFQGFGLALTSGLTWPVANTAFYHPVFLPFHYPVRRVFWGNSNNVASTNNDFGIYTASGTRIYSTGSTAVAGADAPQYVSTDLLLTPGSYYFALACSSTAAVRNHGTTAVTLPSLAMLGVLQQAGALPLPATMTPAAVTNSCFAYCGITRTSTGF